MNVLVVKKKYGSFETFDGSKKANKCLPYDYIAHTENGCNLVKRTEYPLLVGILNTTGSKYGLHHMEMLYTYVSHWMKDILLSILVQKLKILYQIN